MLRNLGYNNLNSDRGGIYAKQPLLLSTGVQQDGNTTTTSFTYDEVKNGDDIYVAFIPNAYTLHFEFEASNGAKYTHTFGQNNIEAGVYYRSFNEETNTFEGIDVSFERQVVDLKDPSNSGATSNWAGVGIQIDPKYEYTGNMRNIGQNGGWVTQLYGSMYYGGWCTPITYTSNGMKDGLLYSTESPSITYFQWGRWMGHTANENMLFLNWKGPSDYDYTLYNDGSSMPAGTHKMSWPIGYQNTGSYNGTTNGWYFAWMATNDSPGGNGWDNTMSKRAAIITGIPSDYNAAEYFSDYLKTNENCRWEDRAGNSCPEGWRIPSEAQFQNIIPTGKVGFELTGKHAEIRRVGADNFAFYYEVATYGKFYCVNIASVPVPESKTSVSINDPIFEGATIIRFCAYGCTWAGERIYENEYGIYWTSDTGTDEDVRGCGGRALLITFSDGGKKATFSFTSENRWIGASVMPIRDSTAKPDPITPYFPLYIQP